MPKLEATLRVPQPMTPGVPVEASIELTAKEPTHIEWAQLRIVGHERWKEGERLDIINMTERFMGDTVFQGTRTFSVTFSVPAGSPPSFQHRDAEVAYAIEIDLSIPWAIDPHWKWPLHVAGLPGATVERDKPLMTSRGGDELSITQEHYVCGDWVRGRVCWFGVDAPNAAYVGVRETLSSPRAKAQSHIGRVVEVRVPLDGTPDGSAFAFPLPEDLTPNFHTRLMVKGWEIFMRRNDTSEARVAAPISIMPAPVASTATSAPKLSFVMPPIDLHPSLLAFGETLGWQIAAGSLERIKTIGTEHAKACVYRIQRETPLVVADLAFPSLALDLRARRVGLLANVRTDIAIGEAEFDKTHTIEGHDAVQVRAFLKPIVQRLARHGLSLGQASDTRLVIECVDAQTPETFRAFLVGVDDVLNALPYAMETIPPLRGVSLDFEGMRKYGLQLGGSFRPANCSLQGKLPSGHPLAFRVIASLEPSNPMLLEVRLEGIPGELSIANGPVLMRGPESLRALLRELGRDVSLEVGGGRGVAIARASTAPLRITPAVIEAMVGWLLRASNLTSTASAFR